MADATILHRFLLHSQPSQSPGRLINFSVHALRCHYSTVTDNEEIHNKKRGKWFTLPPYAPTINGSALGTAMTSTSQVKATTETTALKWVLKSCPELPRNLVQKLFRLRQVRLESLVIESSNLGNREQEFRLKRVAAKDLMRIGDRIYLPVTVREVPCENVDDGYTEEEVNFIRSLELYKDPAIVVVNKPPGMPVQGGVGIRRSLDEIAATCLRYDHPEPPRLVHRLDRDSSGILVMGRTQTSATVLHAIFREKTVAASIDGSGNNRRILQKKYWALVIGSPRRPKGLITSALGKVLVDNGKSDRITVMEKENVSSQHAVTQYRVIKSSSHGYTWLELTPLTGRKHQLRVHCAEVLGTPIVGDYKYGWRAQKKWGQEPLLDLKSNCQERPPSEPMLPFGIDLKSGSILEKHPRLHLHCKQMVLPNVSHALQSAELSSDFDFSHLESIELDASLPSFMQRSWDILSS